MRLDVDIVIPCCGRLDQLKQSLPLWLNQKKTFQGSLILDPEVIVVDYSCTENCHRYVEELQEEYCELTCVKVPNKKYFNLSHSRNIGIRHSDCEYVVVADADSLPDQHFTLQTALTLETNPEYILAHNHNLPEIKGCNGRTASMIRKSVWEKVRGYNEEMEGWGYEEVDFAQRCLMLGGRMYEYDRSLVERIEHDDDLRVANYAEKDRHVSDQRNIAISASTLHVNPNGFGEI